MKRFYVLIMLLSLLTATLSAQSSYEMVVEKTDGTKYYINKNDIKQVYFQKMEEDNSPIQDMLLGNDSDFEGGSMGNWGSWGSHGQASINSPGYKSNYCVAMASNQSVEGLNGQIMYTFASYLQTEKTYRIQFYAKSNMSNLDIAFRYQNQSYDHQLIHTFNIGADWQLCQYDFVIPADYWDVNQIMIDFSSIESIFYVDNIRFGILEGSTPPIENIDVVGTWNIASGTYERYENDVLVLQENIATAPYDRIAFYENGTMEYLEYRSSKGTWHEDGRGNYYMDGLSLVYTGGDWDYFKITSVNNVDEMEVVFQFTETKGSTIVKKISRVKLLRTTESTPRDDDEETGTFLGAKRIFGDNLLTSSSYDEKTYTYHYDDNGFVTQIDKSKPSSNKTFTISYGDKIIINSSSGSQWTASLESHGYIGSIDFTDDKGNAEQVKFTYNDDEQLTTVDYGGGDVYSLTYVDGDITRVTGDGKVVDYSYWSSDQGEIQNTGSVMEFDRMYGIDLDDLDMLYYIGGFGKPTKHLPMSGTKSGYTTTGSWVTDNAGRAIQATFNDHQFKWNWGS